LLSFELTATDGRARRGRLTTPHGVVETPAFMPVGTLGAVKGVPPDTLEALGAQVMLANLYHLTLRPGIDVIEGLGGIHAFTSWTAPILTDSGGYQVFSLASRRRIDDDGVSFRSHVDGAPLRFTPEGVVERQLRLGVDMAMVLDECPPGGASREVVQRAMTRTTDWAKRSLRAPGIEGQARFGIVQGGAFEDIRRAVLWVRAQPTPHPRLEVTGGVTLDRVEGLCATGVQRLSTGSITHSAPALDISMKLV